VYGGAGWEIRFGLDEDTRPAVSEHAYILGGLEVDDVESRIFTLGVEVAAHRGTLVLS
jgi:hypothetical protein